MSILCLENIWKSYSEKKLLCNINLIINENDKIGLIGINGTGKSTLLKIIAGIEHADEGRIIKSASLKIEYLPQEPVFNTEETVIEYIFSGESKAMTLIREYNQAIQMPDIKSERIIELTAKIDEIDGWSIESRAKTILTKLGVVDFNARLGQLSGGQKKRVALSLALINDCDLLILDEPTNHLDNDTIEWLEEYLNDRKGALIMITHDRYFLDRVVNRILEIDNGSLYSYSGNYNYFIEKKIEREDIEASTEKKRQALFKKELEWIRKGAKARTTKQKARIDRFEKLNIEEDKTQEKLEMSAASTRLGKKVIEIKDIEKSYDKKVLIKDFSYILKRDDRIGIVGPNGIGKSTLLNIISKKVEIDSGSIEIGDTVKIGVFSQETPIFDEKLRVIEYIKEGAEYITTGEGEKISASLMLERFLFPSALQWTPVLKLSGGEKKRLYLLRILMESPNVLLLDEPTNDLDIETLKVLEDYIESFLGAVVIVSHDRYFLDRTVRNILDFEGFGKIVKYTGNYSDFIQNKKERQELYTINKESIDKETKKLETKKERPQKFSYKEKQEYDRIDEDIAGLENELSELEAKILKAASDYILLEELLAKKGELEAELDYKLQRWVYLNELAEKIESV